MCGIAGIVNLREGPPVGRASLATMAGQLAHRGPDDEGTYVDPSGRAGLAFRRLSIIDLAHGQQPLANEDESVWVVFNGEIYNFRALRAALEQRGHVFRSRTDTEVIVHLYEEHGADLFTHLHGMFAIAIWDQRRGTLLLGRDRFGQKPLTYAVLGDRLYFASEAKAILALPGVPREIDPQSLHRYLLFQYVPAPHAIFRGFRKVMPGERLEVRAGQPLDATPTKWWRFQPGTFAGSYDDAIDALDTRLRSAVEKRLVADVPLGAFLSGGVDSSIVVALMRQLDVSPLRTFTIGFPDPRYDESAYAADIARQLGTEHHAHTVRPHDIDALDLLAYHYDEPFADSSALPTLHVSRWTRQHVTVALTGDAGDEGFAGYERYWAARAAGRLDVVPAALRQLVARAARIIPHSRPKTLSNRIYRFLVAIGVPPARRYLSWVNLFTPALLAAGYTPGFRDQLDFDEPLRWFDGLYGPPTGDAAIRANRADLDSYLPYDLLTKVDIASMACGLECRCPLLDHELLEFAWSLPMRWRLDRLGGKRILRDWAARCLPIRIPPRPKMGFGVPIGRWLRDELQDVVRQRVLAADGICGQIFARTWLEGLIESHLSGYANHAYPLWALLMLASWAERWQPISISSR
jgi:asparagine synthase (glutamine-hydrolysing)